MNTENVIETDETQIRTLIEERVGAIRLKDVDKAVSSYSDDVVLFDVIGQLQLKGSHDLRKRLDEWFSTLQDPVGNEIQNLRISTDSEVAFCHCLSHINAMTKVGNKLDMWWRETLCWQKINGKWLVTHAHSSVPFDVQDGKASVSLKPSTHAQDVIPVNKTNNNLSKLIEKFFDAYETKDRKTAEDLLSDDFTFTSPYDDHINKAAYFERCWPFSNENPTFKFEKLFVNGNEAFVLYECEIKGKKKFRNTELIRFEGDKIKAVEVYFGDTL